MRGRAGSAGVDAVARGYSTWKLRGMQVGGGVPFSFVKAVVLHSIHSRCFKWDGMRVPGTPICGVRPSMQPTMPCLLRLRPGC